MIRPMASNVSAFSSVVAKGHQAIHFVSSTPSDHAVRRVFPCTDGSQPRRSATFRSRSRRRWTRNLRSFPCLALGPDVSVRGCAHRPLAQRGLSCPRRQTLLRPDAPVGRTPSSLGLLGLLWPVFALAGRSPHLPVFAGSYYSSMPRPLPRWRTEFFCWLIPRPCEPSPFLSRFGDSKIPSSLAS